jgi:hypothetical protein
MCCCPAHDDHNPSFSIRAADEHDGIIAYCFAGCEYDAILKALGLTRAEASGYRAGTLASETPFNELMDRVAEALAKVNDPARGEPQVYQRGGALVQVRYDEKRRPSIAVLTPAGLTPEIARAVHFSKQLKSGVNGISPVYPPERVITSMLVRPRYELPALAGVTEVPVLRPDGTVLNLPGYDRATGLLYRPVAGAAAIAKVAEQPTDGDVAAALALVWEAIGDFPYETLADKANALALLLTPVLRAAIAGQIPLALGDAPRAGTGKSLFTEVIATITVGHNHGKMTEAESDAEWRKKITATLLEAHPVNIIDNVTLPLRSGQLSSALSEPVWRDRILGASRIVHVPSRAVWIATGNNLRLGGDLPRRVYGIRLDARVARPWTRDPATFKHADLLAWVTEERARLVHALLTIARASVVRDVPLPPLPRIGGFDEWVRVVGRAVALDPAVGTHFLGNVEKMWEVEDTEAGEWEVFLAAWYAHFGDRAVGARHRCGGHVGRDRCGERPSLVRCPAGQLGRRLGEGRSVPGQVGHGAARVPRDALWQRGGSLSVGT